MVSRLHLGEFCTTCFHKVVGDVWLSVTPISRLPPENIKNDHFVIHLHDTSDISVWKQTNCYLFTRSSYVIHYRHLSLTSAKLIPLRINTVAYKCYKLINFQGHGDYINCDYLLCVMSRLCLPRVLKQI